MVVVMVEMRAVLFVVRVVFWGFTIVELRMMGAVVVEEMGRLVAGRVVLKMGVGIQDVGMEWLDKAEHAELRESGL